MLWSWFGESHELRGLELLFQTFGRKKFRSYNRRGDEMVLPS